ncbi:hypothetical protein BGZ92_008433 [Podila epicladia]|nr:hypothetical protein BGZ92_008433 [Podila epicladia]
MQQEYKTDHNAGSAPHHGTSSEVDTKMPPVDEILDQESDDDHTSSGILPQVHQIGVTDTIHAIIIYDPRIHIG